MTVPERMLCYDFLKMAISGFHRFAQEVERNPNAPLGGPISAQLGMRGACLLTDYFSSKGKPLEGMRRSPFLFVMTVIAGLGATWRIAKGLGVEGRSWFGEACVLAVLQGVQGHSDDPIFSEVMAATAMCCFYLLEKHRNSSLLVAHYVAHEFTTRSLLYLSNQRIKGRWGKDVEIISYLALQCMIGYGVARVIKSYAGAQAFQSNWTVKVFCSAALGGNYILFCSPRSPLNKRDEEDPYD